jgi:hypothetical protein
MSILPFAFLFYFFLTFYIFLLIFLFFKFLRSLPLSSTAPPSSLILIHSQGLHGVHRTRRRSPPPAGALPSPHLPSSALCSVACARRLPPHPCLPCSAVEFPQPVMEAADAKFPGRPWRRPGRSSLSSAPCRHQAPCRSAPCRRRARRLALHRRVRYGCSDLPRVAPPL